MWRLCGTLSYFGSVEWGSVCYNKIRAEVWNGIEKSINI